MTNAFKYYLPSGKYRTIDETEFIDIATDKVMHNNTLKRDYLNKDITKLCALKIYKILNIRVQPVNALLIEINENDPVLKTIDKIEQELAKFIITEEEHSKEEKNEINSYLKGSKEAMINLLTKSLNYKVIDEERTLEDFLDKEVYLKTEILYKKNKITVELINDKFSWDKESKKIYKYKSSILDPEGYQFHFKKDEIFSHREEAIEESKKLIDEHYNLPIRNSKIQKIIVRTDDRGTIIIFWPETSTDDNYIISNDLIGDHDLGGESKTSMAFFDRCKDATQKELALAKEVIDKCLKLQTYNVKHL